MRGGGASDGVRAAVAGLRHARLGLIAHPASVTSELQFSADAIRAAGYDLRALFGPQHGARGEKQDNMIESDHYTDPVTGLTVHSLYGEVRKPTPEMLRGLDAVLFDLQDVGVRVYTFVWTMALAMEACADAGVRFVVLDRPNPIGGVRREGPVLREEYRSFVGLHPVPLRHGLTCGEMARWLNVERAIGCDLTVIPCESWRRDMSWDDTGLPWVMPSPNLPTPDSCVVYPGMVLVEGTNMSEGRGTTRPFELFGAPWLDPVALVARLGLASLPGVAFRPCHFEPTFQKHAGALSGGAQLHVTDPGTFEPVRTAVEIIVAARRLARHDFAWLEPPYEYEETLPPIDILWGGPGLREGVETGATADGILEAVGGEVGDFAASVERYLLY
ncbi:MAG: DUF1343 domain-containing protein [Gemmatimonadetes bacterium]|nr:DUF1343 domain-containing protein [Gemmatimonadota bacterium]MYE92916.1 DUF1343 domain-containing protein [Gemmatimonadota bacterium]MYJ11073.1 DUF1343 domain-containing protein [Gemmatimonadota bacterium]